MHVVVLFPIQNTVTPRLFNTNLRKDYSLINGSTALLATTFRGTLAMNYMSTNQIRNSCRVYVDYVLGQKEMWEH